jgi:Asp-tRNA(Asn)/Glu-tRNA(Gln) amidotransferase C subunit
MNNKEDAPVVLFGENMPPISFSGQAKSGKKKKLDRDNALLITSSVPVEKGFHFFTAPGKPTGQFATSIFEFLEAVKKVDLKSVEFHLKRNDFSKWLRDVIKDDTLASELEKLRTLELSGEKLRDRIVEMIEVRCKELAEVLRRLAS